MLIYDSAISDMDKQFLADKHLVTIRCLAYNQELYIRQCLEGFIMQKTNFRFEAIVHDDASTDGTVTVIREYAAKYPDIIKPIFEKENLYSKHNGSLTRAVDKYMFGKYIAICEGDDYWIDPLKLQKQVDFMENHPECSMCFHRSQELIEGVNVPFVFSHLKEGYYSGEDILNRWTIPTASVLYRNYGASFQQFCPGIMWRDIFLFLLLADRGRLYCLPDVMSVYRRNAGSVTLQQKRTLPYKRIVGHYKALKKFFPGKYDKIFDQKIMMSYIRQVKAHPFSWESIRSMFFCLIHPIMAVRGFAKILRDRNHRVYQ